MMDLLQQALYEGSIECPNCGNRIEADCEECSCGWKNALVINGFI